MRTWYRERDLLGLACEQLVPPASSLQDTAGRIISDVFDQLQEQDVVPGATVALGTAVRE